MNDRGPIPLRLHAMAEPLLVVVFILAPFVLDFDSDTARALSFVAAAAVLVVGMTTRWRMAIVKLIPLRTHAMLDLGLGVFLILAPFIFGFNEEDAATVFFVVMGVNEVAATFLTRWAPEEDIGRRTAADEPRMSGRGV